MKNNYQIQERITFRSLEMGKTKDFSIDMLKAYLNYQFLNNL